MNTQTGARGRWLVLATSAALLLLLGGLAAGGWLAWRQRAEVFGEARVSLRGRPVAVDWTAVLPPAEDPDGFRPATVERGRLQPGDMRSFTEEDWLMVEVRDGLGEVAMVTRYGLRGSVQKSPGRPPVHAIVAVFRRPDQRRPLAWERDAELSWRGETLCVALRVGPLGGSYTTGLRFCFDDEELVLVAPDHSSN